jgi:hypothetical protein
MKRIQSFEFHELEFCPDFIRESIVETLGTALKWGNIGPAWVDGLIEFCQKSQCQTILELCSGSGVATEQLIVLLKRQNKKSTEFILSDLFPNENAFKKIVACHPELVRYQLIPLNATLVPQLDLHTGLMMLNSFHHFSKEAAKKILLNAIEKGHPIFIHESFPRGILRIFSMLHLLLPAVLFNPWITKKHQFKKILFTYFIPVIPILGLWDGLVSTLRIHSEKEMMEMVQTHHNESNVDFDWTYQEIKFRPFGRATYFYGIPKNRL